MSAGGGEDGIARDGGGIWYSGSWPSCAAGSEQGMVASEESSVSSGNLLESMLLTTLDWTGKAPIEGAVEGRAISLCIVCMNPSGLVVRRDDLTLWN